MQTNYYYAFFKVPLDEGFLSCAANLSTLASCIINPVCDVGERVNK